MRPSILITDATGDVGRALVAAITGDGIPVRVLAGPDGADPPVASAYVEIVGGAVRTGDTLDSALDGIEHVVLLTAPAPNQVEVLGEVVEAAERTGRPRPHWRPPTSARLSGARARSNCTALSVKGPCPARRASCAFPPEEKSPAPFGRRAPLRRRANAAAPAARAANPASKGVRDPGGGLWRRDCTPPGGAPSLIVGALVSNS